MVPEAEFTSYYGRPIVKASPWEADIPAYLFAGGLAAGSSLIAAGADLTGRPTLRRSGRLGAIGALSFSMVALIHDLGKPSRFLNMLRVAKLTSPMSVGTWILSLYGPFAGAVAATEVVSDRRFLAGNTFEVFARDLVLVLQAQHVAELVRCRAGAGVAEVPGALVGPAFTGDYLHWVAA